jgi:hypothetical protein
MKHDLANQPGCLDACDQPHFAAALNAGLDIDGEHALNV